MVLDQALMQVKWLMHAAQTVEDAMTFYRGKQKELGDNLKDLESILQGKSNNLRVVEEGMRSAPTGLSLY